MLPQEIVDKAFRKASKMAALVEDPDKYHRVRKQMNRMVQSSSDTIATTLLDWVDRWPSLNALPPFDQALIDASVGADDYRKNLGGIQWGAEQVRRIAGRIQSEMSPEPTPATRTATTRTPPTKKTTTIPSEIRATKEEPIYIYIYIY